MAVVHQFFTSTICTRASRFFLGNLYK